MYIQSNFNLQQILEPDCITVDIETEDNEKYYFAYKSTSGFVLGYFVTKEEAMLIDKYLDFNRNRTVSFILNENLSNGEIQIERQDVKGKIIIPFLIADKSDVKLYKHKSF